MELNTSGMFPDQLHNYQMMKEDGVLCGQSVRYSVS
jgi:hypothetical protein